MHSRYFDLVLQKPELVLSKKHIINKYAQVFVLMLRRDFPQTWPDAFSRLLELVKQANGDMSLLQKVMHLFVKILLTFD